MLCAKGDGITGLLGRGMFDICDAIYVQFLWLFVQNCLVSGLLHKRTMMRTRLLVNVLQGFLAAAVSVNL